MAPTTFEQLSNLEHFFLPFPWALFFFFVLLFIGFFFLFFFFFSLLLFRVDCYQIKPNYEEIQVTIVRVIDK